MKKIISTATKVAVLALAASSFSFAGPGLADGAAKFVGNITTRGQVRTDFGTYWNQITAENECKWASIEGTRGVYNWNGCDAAYNWAKQKGGHFKFHALLWGSQYPRWLNTLDVDETKKAIEDWFDAVHERYPDLEMIDVVNEAIRSQYKGEGLSEYHSCYSTKPETRKNDKNEDVDACGSSTNKIVAALGGDNGNYGFVAEAFRMARERWPKAVLIYNDYNTVQWQKNEGIDLIQQLKKQKAPVDAYGLQAHDMQKAGGGANGTGGGGSCLDFNTLKKAIEEIWSKTQIPMFITEYDIASYDDQDQKNCYSQQISYFMENEHIAGITIWGYLYGATWTSGGNSGIIKEENGRVTDRPAMTWLKEYLASNKGVNTTGLLSPVEPVPRQYFKGAPFKILEGKIEAEDFDITGVGKNEDGTSNVSFHDGGSKNEGNSDYRKDDAPSVDIYKKESGALVIGYNEEGDWYEYTIDVPETGDYTLYAAVAASGETASLQFSVNGTDLTDVISVPKAKVEKEGDGNFDEFNKVKANVSLSKGTQILRLSVVGAWFDIDYFNFVKGKDAADTDPIVNEESSSSAAVTSSESSVSSSSVAESSSESTASSSEANANSSESTASSSEANANSSESTVTSSEANANSSESTVSSSAANGEASSFSVDKTEFVNQNLHLENNKLQHYHVFDMQGVHMGVISAYGFEAAAQIISSSSNIKSSGVYYLRNRATGKMHTVRIAR